MTARTILSRLAIALAVAAGVAHGQTAPVMGYRVVARLPHSTQSYTEGFFYRDGLFYEGTGMEGRSGVGVIRPETGETIKHVDLAPEVFGEGIVDWGDYVYEWTWKSHVCFVYERATLRLVKQFSYEGEGWGMTRNESQIISSDGSSTLTFRNPDTFQPVRTIAVHDGAKAITQVNELEFIKGEIYANVWHSERIARISPRDGHVIAWIDLTGLLPANERIDRESVLNGIAYDAKRDRLYVTGKQWPAIFEIKIISSRSSARSH